MQITKISSLLEKTELIRGDRTDNRTWLRREILLRVLKENSFRQNHPQNRNQDYRNKQIKVEKDFAGQKITWTSNSTKSTGNFAAVLKEIIEFSLTAFILRSAEFNIFIPFPLCPITANFGILNPPPTPPATTNSQYDI